MRFDNAFKTKANTIGMQFIDKHKVITVYRNKDNSLVVSEGIDKELKGSVISAYMRREKMYSPPAAPVNEPDDPVPIEAYTEEVERFGCC